MKDSRLAAAVIEHKALAHPLRLRILAMLAARPLFVCQIATVLRLALSTLSTHLAILRDARLVIESKEGKWVRYDLSDSGRDRWSVHGLRLAAEPEIEADAAILEVVLRIRREELCHASRDYRKVESEELIAVARRYGRLGRGRVASTIRRAESDPATTKPSCSETRACGRDTGGRAT